MTSQWVGVIANANSGRGKGRQRVERLVDALARQGLESSIAWTPEDRRSLVEQSRGDESCRCLVAVGGDGTLAALVNECPDRPVTVLPAGTENLFARHFGMKSHPEQVAETVASGRIAPIDLGQAMGRRFALMAGMGFDADVVTRHHAARVGIAGRMRPTHRAAYVEPVLRASLGYKFPRLTIHADGPGGQEILHGTTAFVFNLPRVRGWGCPSPLRPWATTACWTWSSSATPAPCGALRYLWMVFRGLHLKREGVWHRKVSRVEVAADQTVPVQLDGDPGGLILGSSHDAANPWTAGVLPAVVGVVVPSRYAMVAAMV